MAITISNPLQTLGYNLSRVILSNQSGAFELISINGASTAAVDTAGIISGATLPLTFPAGQLFFLTAGTIGLYVATGAAWELVPNTANLTAVITPAATLPGSPSVGDFTYLTTATSTHQIGVYVYGVANEGETSPYWVYLNNNEGINPSTGVVPVAQGISFPSVAPSTEFPTDRGSDFGKVGNIFKLTATFEGFAPGVYYNAGTYLTGSISWLPANLTTIVSYFVASFAIGPKLPANGDYSSVIYSPKVVLADGQLFYKNGTDTYGVAGLYVVVAGAWVLAKV